MDFLGCSPAYVFEWAIQNFPCCAENCVLKSPTFSARGLSETKWQLSLFTGSASDKSSVKCCLERTKEDVGKPMEITFEITFVALHDSQVSLLKNTQVFRRSSSSKCIELLTETIYEDKSFYLPQDTLRIRCRIWNDTYATTVRYQATTVVDCERYHVDWTVTTSKCGNLTTTQDSSTHDSHISKIIVVRSDYPGPFQDLFPSKGLSFEISVSSPVVVYSEYLLEEGEPIKLIQFKIFNNVNGFLTTDMHSDVNGFWSKNMHSDNWTWNGLVSLKPSQRSGDDIKIRTEIKTSSGNVVSHTLEECEGERVKEVPLKIEESSMTVFHKALWAMREEDTLCDSKLVTSTGSFNVHRVVLSARSEVFKALFSSKMKEKTTRCVEVKDLDKDTVGRMLLYAYTGCVQLEWSAALKLFYAADKYMMHDLLDKCVHYIEGQLSVNNVCEVLVAADLHSDGRLQRLAESFISSGNTQVFQSQKWKQLEITKPKLALGTLRKIAQS